MLEQRKACRAVRARGADRGARRARARSRAGLVDEQAVGGQGTDQYGAEPDVVGEAVRRVAEDQVVGSADRRRAPAARPGRERSRRSGRACRGSGRSSGRRRGRISTKTAVAAPRDSASSPIAPEPAKRSRTDASIDRADQVEGGLAHAVACRPGVASPSARRCAAPFRAPAMILTGSECAATIVSAASAFERPLRWTSDCQVLEIECQVEDGRGAPLTRKHLGQRLANGRDRRPATKRVHLARERMYFRVAEDAGKHVAHALVPLVEVGQASAEPAPRRVGDRPPGLGVGRWIRARRSDPSRR